jgi:hypothetical protein
MNGVVVFLVEAVVLMLDPPALMGCLAIGVLADRWWSAAAAASLWAVVIAGYVYWAAERLFGDGNFGGALLPRATGYVALALAVFFVAKMVRRRRDHR